MRTFLLALFLTASPAVSSAAEIVMHRDPGCGCCEGWAAQVRKSFGRAVRVVDSADRRALQRAAGMPPGMGSCHTAIIAGIAFEGHVPIADMKRLLVERPRGVTGLAVPGMPVGTPGMEVAGRPADRYTVFAFGPGKMRSFATH